MPRGVVDYANVPPTIGTVLSARMATLHELDTVYGLEDMWVMLEINQVDNHNKSVINESLRSK